jgi:hypothetical protein
MATTSGLSGTLQLDVAQYVEIALRRCGKLPSTISGELIQAARLNLHLILSNFANRGLSLWCVSKTIVSGVVGTLEYAIPGSTTDLLNLLFRRTTVLAPTNSNPSAVIYLMTFATATRVDMVTIQCTSPTVLTLSLERSENAGVSWLAAGTYPAGITVSSAGYSVDTVGTATLWRVRITSGVGSLPAGFTALGYQITRETPLQKMNRDDYLALPNKVSQGAGESAQYLYNKQISPSFTIWPTLTEAGFFVVYTQRQIQDVTTLTELVEVPQRWQQATLAQLAAAMALELPPNELPVGRLEFLTAKAGEALLEAEDGETDGAPIKLSPNIAGYTR